MRFIGLGIILLLISLKTSGCCGQIIGNGYEGNQCSGKLNTSNNTGLKIYTSIPGFYQLLYDDKEVSINELNSNEVLFEQTHSNENISSSYFSILGDFSSELLQVVLADDSCDTSMQSTSNINGLRVTVCTLANSPWGWSEKIYYFPGPMLIRAEIAIDLNSGEQNFVQSIPMTFKVLR